MKSKIIFLFIFLAIGMNCDPVQTEETESAAEDDSSQNAETEEQSEELPQSTHPVWSPDGSRIAFINNKIGVSNHNAINFEVYTMNADGTDVERHTNNTAFEAEIAWSPDGSMLAYKSYRDENDEIYVVDLTTGEERNITNSPGKEDGPQWSKDVNLIYFFSDRDNEKGELYSYNFQSEEIIRLTDNDLREGGATWSPDGNLIAFTSDKDGDDDIYIMETTGENLRQLTNNELYDWYPRWSPDGSKILFTYGDWNTDIFELRIINIDGTGEETIMKEVDSGNASWNPDGTKIAFGSGKSGPGEVYILDLSTQNAIQITDDTIAN